MRQRKAFLPDPLPSGIVLRPSTYGELMAAQEAVGRLDAAMAQVPHRATVSRMLQALDTRSSAAMDGVIVGRREVLAAAMPGAVAADPHPRWPGYQRVSEMIVELARSDRSLDPTVWARMSAAMSGSDVPDDAFAEELPWRRHITWTNSPAGEDLIVHAPPGAELRVATEQWCVWVREQRELPPLVTIILAQIQFLLISPFPGSAHLARQFPILMLMRAGVLRDPVLPLATWLRRHEERYLAVIRGVLDRGDPDELMVIAAEAIREACYQQIELVAELTDVHRGTVAKVARRTAAVRLAEALIDRPMILVREIPELCGVTGNHAVEVARRLHKEGLVEFVDLKTLGFQAEETISGKAIVATDIARLLTLVPSPGPERQSSAG